MLDEKPLEALDWKSRLGDLDRLPGETVLATHDSWEKLHQRLHGNGVRKKAAWYWIAACLLALLVTLPFLSNRKDSKTFNVGKTVTKDTSTANPAQLPLLTQQAKHAPVLAKIKVSIKEITVKPAANINKLLTSTREHVRITVSEAASAIIQEVVQLDTPVIRIIPVATRRKLKVIHINELGEPIEENYKDKFVEHQSFHQKFTFTNNISNSAPGAPSFTQDILKIKITPQN